MNRYLYPTFNRPTMESLVVGSRVKYIAGVYKAAEHYPYVLDWRATVVKILGEDMVVIRLDHDNSIQEINTGYLTHE